MSQASSPFAFTKLEYPSVFVSYAVQGYLDDLYATLVVKLADCESFKLAELWRDAADFETLKGDHHMGIKLSREAAGSGDISVYLAPGVTMQEQVIFLPTTSTRTCKAAANKCNVFDIMSARIVVRRKAIRRC